MPSITRGRSLATQPPEGFVGDDASPSAAQPPGLIPSEPPRAGCPINPRPRNLPEYQAADRAAQGEAIAEYNACEIIEGMQVYQSGRFLAVVGAERNPRGDVEITMHGADNLVAIRVASMTAPVYVLALAPDAIHAPGARAAASQSMAAAR